MALDLTAEQAHEHLMLSPPHRDNLLDPSYNIAGFGVMRSGGILFVVQDFGHSLPSYSGPDAGHDRVRSASHAAGGATTGLVRRPDAELQAAVCSMAKEDRLGTRAMRDLSQRYSVVSYANMHPEVLPDAATRFVTDRRLKSVAVGSCYARTPTYPTGVYWVGLVFY